MAEEWDPTMCGCGPAWRWPKANGTCAACGGWLPGEKPPSLVASWTAPAEDKAHVREDAL